jgi:hypothetical protein
MPQELEFCGSGIDFRRAVPSIILSVFASLAVITVSREILLIGILTLTLLAAPLFDLIRGRLDLFETKNQFLGHYSLAFVVGSLNAALLGPIRLSNVEMDRFVPRALEWAIVGVICFYFGYYSDPARRTANRLPRVFGSWNVPRVSIIASIYFALGFAGYLSFVRTNGGMGSLLVSRL